MAEAAALAFKFVVSAGAKLLVKAGLSKAAAVATSSFVVKTVALTAASAALNVIMSPRVDAAGAPERWSPDPTAPIGVLVGTRGVGGQVIHKAAYGPDNRFLSFVSVISAAGPIKSFGAFKADRLTVTFGSNGVATNGGNFKDNMWLATEPGRQAQPAALIQSGLPGGGTLPNWSAAHKASGKAHMIWTLRQDSKFETYAARPVPICSGAQGVYGYDPRLDSTWPGGSGSCRLNDPSTYVWIDRPGLAALNWALGFRENGKVVAGMNLPISAIDIDAHIALENICEANGWTVSAWPTTADAKGEVYRAFLQAGGATYSTHAGQLSPILRTPKVSVATVSAADTAGPLELDTSTPILERYNTIVPSCVQEAHDWQVVPLEPVKEASYLAADGRETRKGIPYSYVRDANQAAQLAAYDLVDSREGLRGRLVLKPHMRKLKPGHVFTITEPGFALDGVKCLVLKKVKDPASGTVTVTFRSESDGKHAYALGQTTVAPTPPVLSAFDPFDVPAPGEAAWSVAPLTGDAPGLLITGALDADREARSLRVEVRPMIDESGEPLTYPDLKTGWDHVGDYRIDVERIPVTGLRPKTPYEVAVSYISPFNVPGERRSLGVATTGGMVATEARAISGKTRAQIEADLAEARRAAREAGEALIFETTDRYYRIRKVTTLARNLFETERTERTEALLAEAQTRTSQISAVGASVAAVETTVTTLATDLTAETNTLTIQFSALEGSVAAVETSVSTVASDLAAETSARQTQASLFEDNFATLTNQYSTLADAQGAQGDALTSLQVSVNAQGVTLSSLSTDFTTLSASVDLLYAARIIQVGAGAASATISLYAEDQNGNAASKVNISGNTVTIGPNDEAEFRSDGQFSLSGSAGDLGLRYSPWDRNLRIWNPDGTLQFSSAGGGSFTEGIVERAVTAPNAAPTTTFGPWAVGEHNALGNVRGWALQHLSVTLDDAIGGARCAIDWDYDFSFQGKAAQFFTWWERVYLLPVSAGLPGYRQSYGLQNSRLCEQGAGNVNNDSISPTAINANKWLAFPRGGSKNIILPSDAGTVPYRVVLQLCLDRDEIDHSSGNQNGILNPNGSLQYAFESCDISATVFKR